MKALLIDVDWGTGRRAGGIVAKGNRELRVGRLWQSEKLRQEIRLVVNGDVSAYRDIEGIKILNTEEEIDAELLRFCPNDGKPTYSIANEALMVEFIRQKGIDITGLNVDDPGSWAEWLHGKGCIGVRKMVQQVETAGAVRDRIEREHKMNKAKKGR